MKERELSGIQSRFQIPIDHHLRLPTPEEISTPLVGGRGFGVYLASLRAGLRSPLSSFGMEWLDYHCIVPPQLHPNGWAQLVGFTVLCRMIEVPPSVELFGCFYRLRRVERRGVFFTLQRIVGLSPLFQKLQNKVDFESRWVVIEPPPSWKAPLRWCWDNERDIWSEKLDDIGISRAVYRRVIERLCAIGTCNLSDLLTPENIAAAGWGIRLEDMPGTSNPALMPSLAMPEDTLQVEEEEGTEGEDEGPEEEEEEEEEGGDFLRSVVSPERRPSEGRPPVSSEIVFYLSIISPDCLF